MKDFFLEIARFDVITDDKKLIKQALESGSAVPLVGGVRSLVKKLAILSLHKASLTVSPRESASKHTMFSYDFTCPINKMSAFLAPCGLAIEAVHQRGCFFAPTCIAECQAKIAVCVV